MMRRFSRLASRSASSWPLRNSFWFFQYLHHLRVGVETVVEPRIGRRFIAVITTVVTAYQDVNASICVAFALQGSPLDALPYRPLGQPQRLRSFGYG